MLPSLRERLNAGAGVIAGSAFHDGRTKPHTAVVQAGKKPWPDHDKAPWDDGDPDGDDNGAHQIPPGEEGGNKPKPNPDGNNSNMRASVGAAAANLTLSNPEVFSALLAIEARLAEMSLYLPLAVRGLPTGPVRRRLEFLQQII